MYLTRVTFEPKESIQSSKILQQYQQFTKVFSEEASHEFPPARVWDHAIELKPDAPAMLPGKIYPLSQTELQELQKFVDEHLKRHYMTLKEPLCHILFLYQKEGWKTTTGTRLQTYQPLDYLQSLSPSSYSPID